FITLDKLRELEKERLATNDGGIEMKRSTSASSSTSSQGGGENANGNTLPESSTEVKINR
ncbi:hypothetical protein HK102_012274, partial [Quaeritorhiza haematococci]